MSIPKERLHELLELIPDEKNAEVLSLLERYVEKNKDSNKFDPSKYRGILRHLNIVLKKNVKKCAMNGLENGNKIPNRYEYNYLSSG